MVCLGTAADEFIIPSCENGQIKGVIHTLLAFSVIGALEPIRQNVSQESFLIILRRPVNKRQRKEIMLSHIFVILTGPDAKTKRPYFSWPSLITYAYTRFTLITILVIVIAIINLVLGKICGSKVSCLSIWNAHMESADSCFGNAMLLYFIVGPLADVTETVRPYLYFVLHRITVGYDG